MAVIDRGGLVVTAFPLRSDARQRMAERLGGVRVLDMRDCHEEPTLVLAPVCSPQVLEKLKALYPTSPLFVVELEDWELGIDLGGPVKRVLDGGADAYLTADSLDDLADQLRRRGTRTEPIAAAPPGLGSMAVDDLILAYVEAIERRSEPVEAITVATPTARHLWPRDQDK